MIKRANLPVYNKGYGTYQAFYEKEDDYYRVYIWNGMGYSEYIVDTEDEAIGDVKRQLHRLKMAGW